MRQLCFYHRYPDEVLLLQNASGTALLPLHSYTPAAWYTPVFLLYKSDPYNSYIPAPKTGGTERRSYNYHSSALQYQKYRKQYDNIPVRSVSCNGLWHHLPEAAASVPYEMQSLHTLQNLPSFRLKAAYNTGWAEMSPKTGWMQPPRPYIPAGAKMDRYNTPGSGSCHPPWDAYRSCSGHPAAHWRPETVRLQNKTAEFLPAPDYPHDPPDKYLSRCAAWIAAL